MTGITTKGLATRNRIVTAAAQVLRENGVAESTLDHICAGAHISRGQLFHYFPDGREELLLAVAHFEAGRVIDDQQPHLDNLTSWAAWQTWRDTVIERYRRQGPNCALHALMSQVSPGTPAAQSVVTELMRQWHRPLRDGIAAMQVTGDIRREIDPDDAARAVVTAIQGGVQVLMSTGSSQYLESGLDLVIAHLRGVGV